MAGTPQQFGPFTVNTKHPGRLPYKSDGDARRKIQIKPPRETNVGVAQG